MGVTKRIPGEGGSGGGRGHSAMEHWLKTAEIKDSARIVRRRTSREAVCDGLSENFDLDRITSDPVDVCSKDE